MSIAASPVALNACCMSRQQYMCAAWINNKAGFDCCRFCAQVRGGHREGRCLSRARPVQGESQQAAVLLFEAMRDLDSMCDDPELKRCPARTSRSGLTALVHVAQKMCPMGQVCLVDPDTGSGCVVRPDNSKTNKKCSPVDAAHTCACTSTGLNTTVKM